MNLWNWISFHITVFHRTRPSLLTKCPIHHKKKNSKKLVMIHKVKRK